MKGDILQSRGKRHKTKKPAPKRDLLGAGTIIPTLHNTSADLVQVGESYFEKLLNPDICLISNNVGYTTVSKETAYSVVETKKSEQSTKDRPESCVAFFLPVWYDKSRAGGQVPTHLFWVA